MPICGSGTATNGVSMRANSTPSVNASSDGDSKPRAPPRPSTTAGALKRIDQNAVTSDRRTAEVDRGEPLAVDVAAFERGVDVDRAARGSTNRETDDAAEPADDEQRQNKREPLAHRRHAHDDDRGEDRRHHRDRGGIAEQAGVDREPGGRDGHRDEAPSRRDQGPAPRDPDDRDRHERRAEQQRERHREAGVERRASRSARGRTRCEMPPVQVARPSAGAIRKLQPLPGNTQDM